MKKIKKALVATATVATTAAATAVTALAETAGNTSSTATSALQDGFGAMVGDITNVIVVAIPIAMGLIGLVVAIRFGIRWFRGLVSRT